MLSKFSVSLSLNVVGGQFSQSHGGGLKLSLKAHTVFGLWNQRIGFGTATISGKDWVCVEDGHRKKRDKEGNPQILNLRTTHA